MTNTPIGIPSGWEEIAAFWFYRPGRDISSAGETLAIVVDSLVGVAKPIDRVRDNHDWRVVE